MLMYSGFGDVYQASFLIYGDGTTKSITIDLTKNPFNINFTNKPPAYAIITNRAENPNATATIAGNSMIVTFGDAPPNVDPLHPEPAGRNVSIRFIYQ